MSVCINRHCPKPNDPANANNPICRNCGTDLHLQKRYWVLRLLSDDSGFGTIYEASNGGKPKILKVLKLNEPKAIELFQKEAQVLSRLNHPGIPRLDSYFTHQPKNSRSGVYPPLHCIVMEKVDGQNLEEWMKLGPPITQKLAINWLKQFALILQQVHSQHYFHRDIKPANIMRRENGQLVLIDFGTAREMTHTYLLKMGRGQKVTSINSAGYAPLEQVNGKAVPQSDFYALGRTFVYLLTGKEPMDFEENPRTGQLRWRKEAYGISPLLADFIDELMAPFPGNRPENTQVILQRLDKIERQLYQLQRRRQHVGKQALASVLGGVAVLVFVALGGYGYRESRPRATNVLNSPSARTQKAIAYENGFLLNTLTGHTDYVRSLAISPDSQTIVSGSDDKTIKVWNLTPDGRDRGSPRTLKGHTNWVWSVAISPDGKTLVSGGGYEDNTIKVWNMVTGEVRATLTGHTDRVASVAISPDGQTIVSGSDDKTIKVWNWLTGEVRRTLTGHTDSVNSVAISPDGRTIVSGSDDKTIKVWNWPTGEVRSTLTGHTKEVKSVAISANGKTIVSGSYDKTIKVWNYVTGEIKSTLTGHTDKISSIAISANGQTIVSSSADDTIKVWNLATGELKTTLTGHTKWVRCVAISPDGRLLVSGSSDNTIKIWQLPK